MKSIWERSALCCKGELQVFPLSGPDGNYTLFLISQGKTLKRERKDVKKESMKERKLGK